jgi:serine/threonine-protein kinase
MRLSEKRASTADLMRPPGTPSFTSSSSPPRQAVPATPSPPTPGVSGDGTLHLTSQNPQSAVASPQAAEKGSVAARLVIERGGRIGKEFAISGGETNIGRWDADGGIFPDVDLDQDDPEAKVSRRHARIVREGGRFYIEDLGSTNGTFINRGRRLLPGNRHPLNSGDEIIVGKTFLKFVVDNATL